MTTVFDGKSFALSRRVFLQQKVVGWQTRRGRAPVIVSIYPFEDEASIWYTKLKSTDAAAVGIEYRTHALSLKQPSRTWVDAVWKANQDKNVDGILVQKPAAAAYETMTGESRNQFLNWWQPIIESISLHKDVDGLSPVALQQLEFDADKVKRGKVEPLENLDQLVFPATAQAVIDIALQALGSVEVLRTKTVAIIGKSAIVGRPAASGFQLLGAQVQLLGSSDSLQEFLPAADIVVSATGSADLVDAAWIKEGAVLIDVGAPKPEFQTACYQKASFYTPVPGGVGPMTRVCLLENLFKLR